jgi:hypothetical protein
MRIIQEKNENNPRRECSSSLQTAHKLQWMRMIAVSIIQEKNANYPRKEFELSKKRMRIIHEENENYPRKE